MKQVTIVCYLLFVYTPAPLIGGFILFGVFTFIIGGRTTPHAQCPFCILWVWNIKKLT